MQGVVILYADDVLQKLEFFIKAFRFIKSIATNTKEEDLKQKLADYLLTASDLYEQALDLFERLKKGIHFNAHRRRRQAFDFLAENRVAIDSLIDCVFPLGKVVKQYDPNKTQGYY